MLISLIVAVDRANGIGKDGAVPWRLGSDLRRFKALTMGHYLIVGRKTWVSIGRALPGRKMVVISHNPGYLAEGAVVVPDLDQALKLARSAGGTEAFVGGGAQIFAQAMPLAARIYLTQVQATCDCDTFMPPLEPGEWREVERVAHPASELDEYAYTDVLLERRSP